MTNHSVQLMIQRGTRFLNVSIRTVSLSLLGSRRVEGGRGQLDSIEKSLSLLLSRGPRKQSVSAVIRPHGSQRDTSVICPLPAPEGILSSRKHRWAKTWRGPAQQGRSAVNVLHQWLSLWQVFIFTLIENEHHRHHSFHTRLCAAQAQTVRENSGWARLGPPRAAAVEGHRNRSRRVPKYGLSARDPGTRSLVRFPAGLREPPHAPSGALQRVNAHRRAHLRTRFLKIRTVCHARTHATRRGPLL